MYLYMLQINFINKMLKHTRLLTFKYKKLKCSRLIFNKQHNILLRYLFYIVMTNMRKCLLRSS